MGVTSCQKVRVCIVIHYIPLTQHFLTLCVEVRELGKSSLTLSLE
jgi:hypothetical protein